MGLFQRIRDAMTAATPMGAYRRARRKGASAEDAIFDAIQVLRYRTPWAALSDEDLRYAANLLGTLPDPAVFAAIVIEIEKTQALDPITNRQMLGRFVDYVRTTPGV